MKKRRTECKTNMANYVLKLYQSQLCKNCRSYEKKSQRCPFLYLLLY